MDWFGNGAGNDRDCAAGCIVSEARRFGTGLFVHGENGEPCGYMGIYGIVVVAFGGSGNVCRYHRQGALAFRNVRYVIFELCVCNCGWGRVQ